MEVVDRAILTLHPEKIHAEICSEDGAVLLVNKPYGETSFYVVNRLRKALSNVTGIKRVKVGHAGTLDPLADGLLLIATRRKTKSLSLLTGLNKTYVATIRFGISSPSFDLERPITIEATDFAIDESRLAVAVAALRGQHMQIPPIYSAIKQEGRPVYHAARRGEEPIMTARSIEIYSAELVAVDSPYATIRIICSKGTYVRSIVRDLAKEMGTIGLLTFLRRDKVGDWKYEDGLSVKEADDFIRSRAHLSREDKMRAEA